MELLNNNIITNIINILEIKDIVNLEKTFNKSIQKILFESYKNVTINYNICCSEEIKLNNTIKYPNLFIDWVEKRCIKINDLFIYNDIFIKLITFSKNVTIHFELKEEHLKYITNNIKFLSLTLQNTNILKYINNDLQLTVSTLKENDIIPENTKELNLNKVNVNDEFYDKMCDILLNGNLISVDTKLPFNNMNNNNIQQKFYSLLLSNKKLKRVKIQIFGNDIEIDYVKGQNNFNAIHMSNIKFKSSRDMQNFSNDCNKLECLSITYNFDILEYFTKHKFRRLNIYVDENKPLDKIYNFFKNSDMSSLTTLYCTVNIIDLIIERCQNLEILIILNDNIDFNKIILLKNIKKLRFMNGIPKDKIKFLFMNLPFLVSIERLLRGHKLINFSDAMKL